MTGLVIVGAGGHAREVLDVAEAAGVTVAGFVADPAPDDDYHLAAPYLGSVDVLPRMRGVTYVIGIGSGAARRRIDLWAEENGLTASPPLIHPSATLGRHRVELSPGVIICAHAALTTNIRVGRHTHLNLSTTVAHDSVLGSYVTVSPMAAISGNVVLDDGATVGTGAAVRERIVVGADAVVGAGAAVVSDVAAGTTVGGVPAKVLAVR